MMKYVTSFLAAVGLLLAGAVPAAAYTVGASPPAGLGAGSAYLQLDAGGQKGYIFPTAAQLDLVAIGPADALSANLSAVTQFTARDTYYTVVAFPFFASATADNMVGFLVLNLSCAAPYGGGNLYPVTVRWYWRVGNGTSYFGGTPSPVAGPVTVLDTNIPAFAPRNEAIAAQSPERTLMLALCVLLAVFLLLQVIQFMGRYRKGASGY